MLRVGAAGETTPVTSASVERVGTGQMGTSYRVTLGWADPDAATASGAPATVIAKMAAGPRESRGVISEGYRAEVGFYTEIAHTLAVRPLVSAASSVIVVEPIEGWADDLLVSFDGQTGFTLAANARVEIRRAESAVCLVRLHRQGYFSLLRDKLHWGDLSTRE